MPFITWLLIILEMSFLSTKGPIILCHLLVISALFLSRTGRQLTQDYQYGIGILIFKPQDLHWQVHRPPSISSLGDHFVSHTDDGD